jgi:hypothetical protein
VLRNRFSSIAIAAAVTIGPLFVQIATAPPTNALPAKPSFSKVYTLGDSFSAGTGTRNESYEYGGPPNSINRLCWRKDDENTGARLAEAFAGGVANQVNLACAGAQKPELDQQIASLNLPDGGAGVLINLTAFGNDFRSSDGKDWPSVITRCARELVDCQNFPGNTVTQEEIARIAALAEDSFRKLVAKAPKATIRILAYPHLFEPFAFHWGFVQCYRQGPFGSVNVDGGEALYLDRLVDGFNDILRNVTTKISAGADVQFVDVQAYFGDKAFCKADTNPLINEVTVNDIIFDRNVRVSSLHPTTLGYWANYRAVAASLTTTELDGDVVSFRYGCNRTSMIFPSNSRALVTTTKTSLGNVDNTERWLLRRVGTDLYTIRNQQYGSFLATEPNEGGFVGNSVAPKTVKIVRKNNGYVELVDPSNPNVLVTSPTANSGDITMNGRSANTCTQQFQLFIPSSGDPTDMNLFDGKIVTLKTACGAGVLDSAASSNRMTLQTANGSAGQALRFRATGPDTYEITNEKGQVIGVEPGTGIIQLRSEPYSWFVQRVGTQYQLWPTTAPNLAVDLNGARVAAGTIFQLWTRNGTCAQQFDVTVIGSTTPTPVTPPPAAGVSIRSYTDWGWGRGLTNDNVYSGDFNGDGKTDVLLRYMNGATHRWDVGLSNGATFVDGGNWFWGAGLTTDPVSVGDFNGDKKSDVLVRWFNGTKWTYLVAVSTGTGFRYVGDWATGWGTSEPISVGDFNGDGKSDVLLRYANANGTYTYLIGFSTGTSFAGGGDWANGLGGSDPVRVGDFNGDGKSDVLLRWMNGATANYTVALSTGTGFTNVRDWNPGYGNSTEPVYVGDFNGDKKSDILVRYNNGSRWLYVVAVSTGSTFQNVNADFAPSWGGTPEPVYVGDYNGDTKSDILLRWNDGTKVRWGVGLT